MPHLPASAWWTPGVFLWTALVGAVYAWIMWGPIRERIAGATAPSVREALCFYGSLLALYLSLGSPLGALAMGYLFTAHMIQHMIAAMLVPPLFIRGLPVWAWRAILKPRAWGYVFRQLVKPLPAILLFNIFFGLMVLPPVITAMVDSMTLMVVLHLGLAVLGVFMWWPLLSPLPELPPLHLGLQVLYLFADGIPMILPLALVALDTSPLYTAAYGAMPRIWGLDLVQDQQLGAASCLVGVHLVYGGMLAARFFAWARVEPARDEGLGLERGSRHHLRVVR